jgi:hypothetical protein
VEDEDISWVGKHPWKPFDREKDMGPTLSAPKTAKELLKTAGELSSRFSGGASQRSFL